jgi:hypothetical protein
MQILAAIALNPHAKKPLAPDKLIRVPSQKNVSKEDKKADLERKMSAYKKAKEKGLL